MKCPHCSGLLDVKIARASVKPAQQEMFDSKRPKPSPAAFGAAEKLRVEVVKRFPDSPCATEEGWKKIKYRWAISFNAETRDLDKLVRMAAWAMDNGFTIDSPAMLKKKEGAIVQRKSQVDGTRRSPESATPLL